MAASIAAITTMVMRNAAGNGQVSQLGAQVRKTVVTTSQRTKTLPATRPTQPQRLRDQRLPLN